MSTAQDLFDDGRLAPALELVTQEVKTNPADPGLRTFLFELLCFFGDWDRAEKQLAILGGQSQRSALGVLIYQNNIKAERARGRLFSEGIAPHFLLDPPEYVGLHIDALSRIGAGQIEEARQMLIRAGEAWPALRGQVDGSGFQDFRDYDAVLGPVLEVIIQDKYVWLPFEQIKRLEIATPQRPRDLIWIDARIETIDQTIGKVYLPTLYFGSCDDQRDEVKLGRMSDSVPLGEDLYRMVGLRLFLIDKAEKEMLQVKSIEFSPSRL